MKLVESKDFQSPSICPQWYVFRIGFMRLLVSFVFFFFFIYISFCANNKRCIQPFTSVRIPKKLRILFRFMFVRRSNNTFVEDFFFLFFTSFASHCHFFHNLARSRSVSHLLDDLLFLDAKSILILSRKDEASTLPKKICQVFVLVPIIVLRCFNI